MEMFCAGSGPSPPSLRPSVICKAVSPEQVAPFFVTRTVLFSRVCLSACDPCVSLFTHCLTTTRRERCSVPLPARRVRKAGCAGMSWSMRLAMYNAARVWPLGGATRRPQQSAASSPGGTQAAVLRFSGQVEWARFGVETSELAHRDHRGQLEALVREPHHPRLFTAAGC